MIKAVRAGRRAGSSRLFKSAYRKSQRIPAVLALLAMLWYSAVPAGAATNTWTNTSGDALWDTIANWSLGAAPLAVDDAIFPTPVPANGGTVTLGTGDVANSLTFRDVYTLTGGDLTLTSGNITVAPTFTATINSVLKGSGGLTLASSNGLLAGDAQVGGGTLVLGGTNLYSGVTTINGGVLSIGDATNLGDGSVTNSIAIANNAVLSSTGLNVDLGANRTIALGTGGGTLDVGGSNALTVSGAISGATALTKTGTGTLNLAVANSYGGGTLLNGGTLLVGNNSALSSGALTVSGGSTLASSDGTAHTLTNPITLNSDVTLGQASGGTGALALNGTLNLGGATRTITVNNASDTLGGVVSNGGITKMGAGTLLLKPGNTFGGPLNINEGTIAVDSVANDSQLGTVTAINFNGGTFSQTIDGQYSVGATRVFNVGAGGGTFDVGLTGAVPSARKIFLTTGQLTGSGGLTKTGGGDLQLNGANAGYSGSWNINGGVVEAQNNTSLGSGPVSINTGGELVVTMPAAITNALTLNGGTLSANGTSGNTPYTGTLNVAANSNIALRLFQGPTTPSSFGISGPISGTSSLTVSAPAAATLTLSGNNSGFTGALNINTNAIVQANTRASLTGGGIFLAGGTFRDSAPNTTDPVSGPNVNGLDATYYNFGTNETTVATSNKYAVDRLYITPRFATTLNQTINLPNNGNGTQPINYVPGFHVGTANTNDGIMWKGLLNITTGGNYTISSPSDDGSLVYIDGQLVVSNDGGHGIPGPAPNGTINLASGFHNFVVRWSQGGGSSSEIVSYSGPDTSNASVLLGSTPGTITTGSLAATEIGPVSVTSGTGTIDAGVDTTSSSLNLSSGTTLAVTSGTISSYTVTGATTLGGNVTLAPTTGKLVLAGAIGDGGLGAGVTMSGPYLAAFKATNTYGGTTTVTGGELDLDASGGNSIPGNLTINAPNAGGAIRNVRLLQSDQIADTSTVTVTQGILDIGSNSDTVASLTLNGGTILGTTGVLTPGSLDLQNGVFAARLGGVAAFTKTSGGTVVLSGNNSTYDGAISVQNGVLVAGGNNALGSSVGDTVIAAGAALQLQGGINLGSENVTAFGTGISNDGVLRNMAGDNTIGGTVLLGGVTTVQSESGNLIFGAGGSVSGGDLTVQGAGDVTFNSNPTFTSITKAGGGTLTFGTNQSTLAGVNFQAGTLGFSGAQSFGAATIPNGLAFRFNSDPGAGVSITSPAGTRVIAGYAPDAALLSRITAGSTGALVLTGDTSNNLDFSAGPNMSLGALGRVRYTGTITPNSSTYKLGGGGGELTVTQVLSGANGLNVSGGIVSIPSVNTFTGGITVDAGGVLRVINNPELGNFSNSVTLTNGGVLSLINGTDNAGNQFGQLGNVVHNGAVSARNIVIGAGGGVIDMPTRTGGSTGYAITGTLSGAAGNTLTKTGFGNLLMFTPATFAGDLVIAPNSGQFEMRALGSLSSVNSVTVGQSTLFVVDNNNGLGTRQYASVNNNNRVNDAAPINLQGGQLLYRARNTAAQTSETFGTVTLGRGQNQLRSELANTTSQGSDIIITNLVRQIANGTSTNVNNGTLLFTTNNNVFATGTANNRVKLTAINGTAPVDQTVLPWGSITSTDVPVYSTTNNLVQVATYTAINNAAANTTVNFTPTATQNINLTAGATPVTYAITGGASPYSMNSLRFGGGANVQTLTFATGTDTLNIVSGDIQTDNGAIAHTIGSASGNGSITAGPVGATSPQELFVHNNNNTLTINSVITDNNGQPVSLIKDLDGPLQLSAANTYSGGTFVYRSRINTTVAGALGSGPVLVKGGNSVLQLGAAGATSNTSGIVGVDQAEIFLNSQGPWTNQGDRFIISNAGSMITGSESVAGQGLNSLTRVATPADVTNSPNGGVIYLAPGSMVSPTNMVNGDIGTTNMINNLGKAADLFFSPSGANANVNTTLSVGAGTPWKGIATGPTGRQLSTATIIANGDFILQGSPRDNTVAVLTLGQANNTGSIAIVNNAGKPINALVQGQVALGEDTPVSMPTDLTFVVQPGGFLQPNFANSFGQPGSTAKVLVQGGGVLDPGNYVQVGAGLGAGGNQPIGFQYPAPSNMNANITLEAEGRMILNDASGAGSTTNGNTWTFKAGSILHLATAQALLGSWDPGTGNTGKINPAQFNFEPGVTVRIDADNVFDISHSVLGAVNGEKVILQLVNNRTLTSQINPMTTLNAPENIFLANGGMLTNDNNDRQANEGRGNIILGDGAILAGTNQTFLNVQDALIVQPNVTVTVGANRWINGLPKLGGVNLIAPNNNVANETNTFSVTSGATLVFGAANSFPDKVNVDLPATVNAFPTAGAAGNQPGNGSTLLLNTGSFLEIMGKLTGNGAVIGGAGTPAVGAGFGAPDFTFNGVFKNTNSQQPELYKVGVNKMTLTGSSDATGNMGAMQGTLVLAGGGNTKFGTVRAMQGGTIVVDNSGTALNNRTGIPSFWVPSGGNYNLIGNATTPVTEAVQNLAISVGAPGALPNVTTGYTFLNVTPGAAQTQFLANAFEHPANNGIGQQRSGTWVLRTPTITNLPGSYNTGGLYAPNGANAANGMISAAIPNFLVLGASGNPTVPGMYGTPLAPSRGDFLGDANLVSGQGSGFITEDYVVFNGATTANSNVITLTAGYNSSNLAVGMPIGGTNIPSGSVITAVSPTSVTISNNITTAGTNNFNVVTGNGVRLLTANEYTSNIFDNVNAFMNVKLTGTASPVGDTRVGTLTMAPGSTLNINGTVPQTSTPSRLLLNGSGLFVPSGGAATINGGTNNFFQVNAGVGMYFHTQGDLNLNAQVFTDQDIVKTGAGTLNAGAGALSGMRGSIEVDAGALNLNAANNSLANSRNGQTGFNAGGSLFLNGGTLNLNGNSQLISQLTSANPLFGQGGAVTSASPATLTIQGGGQFSGTVGGAVSLDKVNTNTLVLTNANTNTGPTLIRAGSLELRDSGTLSNTSNVDLYYGSTLTLNNGYLNNVVDRVNPAATLNVRGGNIQMTGAAGQVASQTINTMNLLAGRLDYNANSGGAGAIVFNVGNFNRGAGTGSTFTINQNFGFTGATGNDTDAIRFFINNLNGAPVALNDGIIGGWAVMNGAVNGAINFMTYKPAVGIGTYGNTADGFNAYESTNITTATATQNVNDTTAARTLAANTTVNSYRIGPNAASTITMNANIGLTIDTGGLIIDNNNTTNFTPAASTTGQSITSNSGELDVWINQNTATFSVPVIGSLDLVKSGGGTLTLAAQNTFNGKTFVNSGTINLSLVGANGTSITAVPGDVVIQGAGVLTELAASQLNTNATITVLGNGRFNAMNAAGITETIGALVFGDAAGAPAANSALDLYDRTASQPTSTLLLSKPVAISGTNTNPNIVPFIGTFAGILGFTNSTGSTINVNAPTGSNGLAALGLRIDAAIGQVPTGIAEGGLIKQGTGMMILNPGNNTVLAATGSTTTGSNTITVPTSAGLIVGQTITGAGIPAGSYITSISGTTVTLNNAATATATTVAFTANIVNPFGSPSTLTDVLNVSQGIVRAEQSGALGSNFANTTVQSGAGILGAVGNNQPVLGSIKLKDGSFLGTTNNINVAFGAATTTPANQSFLNVAGNTTMYAVDYFLPATGATNNNITINSKLTGSGNINIVGPQINGATGTVQLGNPIATGAGSSDYSGTITVNPNAILQNQQALIAPNVSTTGSALGNATINLNGGRLRLRDDFGTAAATITNTSINYGNNVTLSAASFLDANQNKSSSSNDTINLGTLTVQPGTQTLTVDSGNGYVVGFNQLDGSGTLVKAGQGGINVGGYAGSYTGSIAIAGPALRNIAPTFNSTTFENVNFVPAVNTFPSFNVNGFYTLQASKTFNVTNFNVNANPGNLAAMLAVRDTSTVNAGTFQNNGQVAATGGAATINASTGFTGSGLYLTNGQPLTLAGNVTGGTLHVAGNNTVSVTGASVAPAAAEIQSGALRIAPTAPATVSGTFNVLGSPASTASATAAPIAPVTGALVFDAGANAITHTGNISNSGTVRAASGTTNVNGTISGTSLSYTPGLLEGYVAGAGGAMDVTTGRAANPGNFGIRLEPRMLQTNPVTQNVVTGHLDNELWVYTGYVKDDDGVFSFAENLDDRAAVWIDGTLVLNANNGGTSRVVSTAFSVGQQGTTVLPVAAANSGTPSQNFGPGITLPGRGGGWHLVEIRFGNGAGGSGPINGNGFATNYGFGYKNGIAALDGADMIKPIDDGTGNLFVTPVGGKGNIEVLADATLNAGGFALIGSINLTAGTSTTLKVTAAGTNDADNLNVIGAGNATLDKVAGVTVNLANVNVGAGTTLVMAGDPTSTTNLGTSSLVLNGNLTVNGDPVVSNSAGTGSGIVTLNTNGTLITSLLADGGTPSGIGASSNAASNLVFNGGTLVYTGPTASTDRSFTLGAAGGTINASGTGDLTFSSPLPLAYTASTPGTRTLTLTGTTATSNTLAAAIADNDTPNADITAVTKTGPNAWTLSGNSTYTGPTTVNGGTLVVTGSIAKSPLVVNNTGAFHAAVTQTVKSATVNAGGIVRVPTGGPKKVLTVGDGTSTTNALTINGGKVDVQTNAVIVDYATGGEGTVIKSVRNQIIAGYNGGDWQGNGITSTAAAADSGTKAIGYAEASEVLGPSGGTFFDNPSVDATSVIARYTIYGDATLDGSVDFQDLVKLAQNYGSDFVANPTTESWWYHGDFTYDGKVDFNDLVKLAQNYGSVLPSEPVPGAPISFGSDVAAAFSLVPEPGAIGLLAIGALGLLRRKRR